MRVMKKSGEDYLETVLQLSEENEKVRTTDVANRLGVSKPSVNRAMKILACDGYIEQETYGDIHLTEKGRLKAAQVYFRHKTLTSFFVDVLGVDPVVAEEDACLIEHDISSATMEKLASFLQSYLESEP
jgi:DtxR family Mn-dependent transcriptional regulator